VIFFDPPFSLQKCKLFYRQHHNEFISLFVSKKIKQEEMKMSEKENKEMTMKVNEEFNAFGGDASRVGAWIDKYFVPGITFHSAGLGDLNFEQTKQMYTELATAFDPVITVKHVIAEGDMVAFNGSWSGTHQGTYKGIPATGKKVEVDLAIIVKLSGGKTEEEWTYQDTLGLMTQLGAIPGPAPAK
jgi:predicted ester cyclase